MSTNRPLASKENGRFAPTKQRSESFEESGRKIHGDKYDYSKVVLGASVDSKITIVCPVHGEFQQKPRDHLKGQGCPHCGREVLAASKRGTVQSFTTSAVKIHGLRYDYSKVAYQTDKISVLIGCRIHGDFLQRPNSHLNGQGCPQCAKERGALDQTKTTTQFVSEAEDVHGRGFYDYRDVIYRGGHHKVTIICPKHGPFKQRPSTHLRGCACPHCKSSKGEKRLQQILTKHNIKFIPEYKLPNINLQYRYDLYLYELDLLIEFHGEQHFRPVDAFGGEENFLKGVARDWMKKSLAASAGIPMLEFTYREFRWPEERFEEHVMENIKRIVDYYAHVKKLLGGI